MGDPIKDSTGFGKCKDAMIEFGFEDVVKDMPNSAVIDNGLKILLMQKLDK